MNNKQIVAFFRNRAELSAKKLPMKLAYALKLNYEKLQPCAKAYDEQLSEIRKKYENKSGAITPAKAELFQKDLEELLCVEVSQEVQKVGYDILARCDEEQFDNLTVDDLDTIGFMLEE